jgi:hypothetical protein
MQHVLNSGQISNHLTVSVRFVLDLIKILNIKHLCGTKNLRINEENVHCPLIYPFY